MDRYESLKEIEDEIAEWEADDVYPGDRGFQRLLERRNEILEELDEEE
jgi:hypothetical protein